MSRLTPGAPGNFSSSSSGLTDAELRASPVDVDLQQVGGASMVLGQATMAASFPVTIASNQASIPVGATLTAETTKVIGTVRIVGNVGGVFDQVAGSAAPANALQIGVVTGSSNLNALGAASQQGDSNSGNGAAATSQILYNGSNYDRRRSIINANDTIGTGIAAAGILAQFDDTSPGTVTENRFGNIRMSVRREMYTQIRDAAGNERGMNVDSNGEIGISAIRNALPAGDNRIGRVKLTDDTNIQNVMPATSASLAASAQGAGLVGGAFQTQAISYTTTGAKNTTDVGNYRFVSVQITALGTDSSPEFQASNDNSNWFPLNLSREEPSTQQFFVSNGAASQPTIHTGVLTGRYFRINDAEITAGTTTGQLVFTTLPSHAEVTPVFHTAFDNLVSATDSSGGNLGIQVSGTQAHNDADDGRPVKIGGHAVDIGANGTDVSAADRTNAKFLRSGQLLTLGGHQNIVSKNLNVTDADGAQTDAALVTVSAGTAIVVTKLSVMADGANSGDVAVRIGFGTANVPAADSSGIILAHPGIKSGSGVVEGNGAGIIGMGASNEDLRVTCEDPAGGAIDIIVTYFTVAIG